MNRHVLRLLLLLALPVCVGCQAVDAPSRPPDIGHPTPRPTADLISAESARPAPNEPEMVEPTGAITLRDAAALALIHNPDLKTFPYAMRAAEARVLQARLLPNPEIEVALEEFGGSGRRNGFTGSETTISLGQLIELGGKRDKRIRLASLDEELIRWDYESARLNVMKEVARAFVAVLAAQERLLLTQKLRDLAQDAHSAVAQRVEVGKDSPVDDLRADVALSRSRIEVHRAGTALATARHRLAATWGSGTPSFEKAAGDFYQVSQPRSLGQAARAIRQNPDLGRWKTQEQKRRAALHLEEARATSDLTIAGGVRYYEETDDTGLVFGLGLPLPLFDRNQGGIREATANVARTRQEYEAVKIKTLTALAEAANGLAGTYDEISILDNEVLPKAQQAFEAACQGYEEGKFDYLYVLDTERTLCEMQGRFIDSVQAYHNARADVERLIGQSLDAAGQGRPRVASPGQ